MPPKIRLVGTSPPQGNPICVRKAHTSERTDRTSQLNLLKQIPPTLKKKPPIRAISLAGGAKAAWGLADLLARFVLFRLRPITHHLAAHIHHLRHPTHHFFHPLHHVLRLPAWLLLAHHSFHHPTHRRTTLMFFRLIRAHCRGDQHACHYSKKNLFHNSSHFRFTQNSLILVESAGTAGVGVDGP